MSIFKQLTNTFYRPIIQWYLKSERKFSYEGITLNIKPGIFYPGLFYSTKFLLQLLKQEDLSGKHLLELGCGSGLISMVAADMGATVLASDINASAIEALNENVGRHPNLSGRITTLVSDLFENIPQQHFDHIVINPPFYPRDPRTPAEHAWYCGQDHDYFRKLFTSLPSFMDAGTSVWVVLSSDCNFSAIGSIARGAALQMKVKATKKTWLETETIYEITRQ